MTRLVLASLLLVAAFSAHLAAAAPHDDGSAHAHPHPDTGTAAAPPRKGSHCWRILVNCTFEPDHECCGVGANQPPSGSARQVRQAQTLPGKLPEGVQTLPATLPGKNTKPLPRPGGAQTSEVQTLPAEVPDRGQPSTGPQVEPEPSSAQSGVQTLPAKITENEQPSTGPQVQPQPQGVQTLPAEIPSKETKPFPRPQGQPQGVQTLPGDAAEEGKPNSRPQVEPKPESGVQTVPAEVPEKQTKPLPRPQRPVQTLPAELPQE